MKRLKLLLTVCITLVMVCVLMSVTVSAADYQQSGTFSVLVTENKQNAPVSLGLKVLAEQKPMNIAGIKGNALYFSADRFACAMNVGNLDSITITRLPDNGCGTLYIGSEGVSVGQRIKASDIGLMTYEEESAGVGKKTSFEFIVNDTGYAMTCYIHMIDKVNYSPTLSIASFASLNTETYRDVGISGVLSAYDPEGDELRFEIVRYPENGRVVINNEKLGTYTYMPYSSYTGEDSFEYVVSDIYGNYSASATVKISVSAQKTSTVYKDLLNNDLYSHAIAVTENGLMNGIQVGDYYYFQADREVTRAEFVVTAMNAIGIKSVPDVESTIFYDDKDINSEMKGYISMAFSKGFISGSKENGMLCFKPDEKISLSEAAVIISNMIGYAEPKVSPVFADAEAIPEWSGKAIRSLHTLGILEAPDMVIGAGETVTRGDMARLLNKTMFVIGK